MKTKNIVACVALTTCMVGTLQAQTQYDAARLMDTDLNGTARFVGMGGAMSALGGDVSTMGTNPAGIGLLRSNDVSLSLSVNDVQSKSDFAGNKQDDGRTRMSFDQIGVIFSNKIGDKTSLRYFNYGFNYHKKRNFNKAMVAGGDLMGLSMTDQIAWMGNTNLYGDFDPISEDLYSQIYDDLDGNYYGDNYYDISWLSVLGIQGGLIGPEGVASDGGYCFIGMPGYYGRFASRETGGVNEFDLNLSGNVNDRFFWGATIGFYDVNYKRSTSYYEEGEFNGVSTDYTLENSFRTEGAGYDLKLGVIWRPIDSSPFRVGLAIHTPTLYQLTDHHSATLFSSQQDYWGETDRAIIDYELLTPWKFNFSLGHTIGTSVALGAEYEFADYSSADLRYEDGVDMEEENIWIDEDLKGVHTLRLGVEAKLVPQFSLRVGYNYSSAAFDKGAYKWLYPNSTRTDVEYENSFARNIFTVGMGYRANKFYADAAFQYAHQKSDFYPYDSQFSYDAGVDYPYTTNGLLPATEVVDERCQLLFTLGYKF